MSVIPKAAQLADQINTYVGSAESIVKTSLAAAQDSTGFAEVYHISLSTDAVLRGLTNAKLQPRLVGSRSIVLRIPFLVGVGQRSVAMVELRRFVELICWTVYLAIIRWNGGVSGRSQGAAFHKTGESRFHTQRTGNLAITSSMRAS